MSANRFKMLVQIVHPPSPQISPQSLPASKVHDGIAATSEAHPSLSKKKTIFLPQINIHLIEAAFVSKMGFRNFDNMENQDAILLENISNKCKVYGIFDGHGQHGKMMSRTAKSVFQS